MQCSVCCAYDGKLTQSFTEELSWEWIYLNKMKYFSYAESLSKPKPQFKLDGSWWAAMVESDHQESGHALLSPLPENCTVVSVVTVDTLVSRPCIVCGLPGVSPWLMCAFVGRQVEKPFRCISPASYLQLKIHRYRLYCITSGWFTSPGSINSKFLAWGLKSSWNCKILWLFIHN